MAGHLLPPLGHKKKIIVASLSAKPSFFFLTNSMLENVNLVVQGWRRHLTYWSYQHNVEIKNISYNSKNEGAVCLEKMKTIYFSFLNKNCRMKCLQKSVSYRQTYLLMDKLIHRGAPLLKTQPSRVCIPWIWFSLVTIFKCSSSLKKYLS